MKIILLLLMLLLASCTNPDTPSPSNTKYNPTFEYFKALYEVEAYPDSMQLWFGSKNTLTGTVGFNLGYKIRGYTGNGNNAGVNFVMPLSDTVTVTWYDGNGDSLPITLRINPKFFNGISYGAQESHTLNHPGDTQLNYDVRIDYYDSLQGSWCSDSSGIQLAYSDTLHVGNRISTPAAHCNGNTVISMRSIGNDTVAYGEVQRAYLSGKSAVCFYPDICTIPGIRLP